MPRLSNDTTLQLDDSSLQLFINEMDRQRREVRVQMHSDTMRQVEQMNRYRYIHQEGGLVTFPEEAEEQVKARKKAIKAYYKKEVEYFKKFMATGSGDGELYLRVDLRNRLLVLGEGTEADSKICLITSKSILAHKARSKHLGTLIEHLALREGLRLSVVDELPAMGNTSSVYYWQFNEREEVDDSELLKIEEPQQTPRGEEIMGNIWTSEIPF